MEQRPSCTLVIDGGVDLPAGLAAEPGVHIVPLMVHFGNETFRSGVDITAEQFYRRLRERGEFPTTSQPSAGEYKAAYERAAEAGLPILSIHVSSGLSGSFNSARTAREMLPHLDITLVDTRTLSGEMSMQVMVALDQARRGVPVPEIKAALEKLYQDSHLYFTIDKLDYLRKGGRIGRVAGAVGSLLGIRPIVTVDKSNGTYIPAGKARSFRRAIDEIAEKIIADVGEGKDVSVMIMQGDVPEEVARLKAVLEGRLKVVWFQQLHANPSLGAHIGPDALGVAYYPGALPLLSLEPVGVR
ncbi:MAG: DegV family protein [Bacillota bacterium]